MTSFKPHSKSTRADTSNSNYSVATGFNAIGNSTQNLPPDLETEQDNRVPPKPEIESESREEVGLVPPPLGARYLVVCHALIGELGKSVIVAAVCGEAGKFNTTFTPGNKVAPIEPFSLSEVNAKPLSKKNTILTNPNLALFTNVSSSAWYKVDDNAGARGEHEYDAGGNKIISLLWQTFETTQPSRFVFSGLSAGSAEAGIGEVVRTFNLGKKLAGRTQAYNNCLSGAGKSYRYNRNELWAKVSFGTFDFAEYTIIETNSRRQTGTQRYEGKCRQDESGESPGSPVHECFMHVDNGGDTPDNPIDEDGFEEYNKVTNTENKAVYAGLLAPTISWSLYHLYANHNATIEYFGSVWMLDPYLPRCEVSKDDQGGLDLRFYYGTELKKEVDELLELELKTKYTNNLYPANSDFTNSFNSVTITQAVASNTLAWASDVLNPLANTNASVSNYYGLGELGYVSKVIGAASLV